MGLCCVSALSYRGCAEGQQESVQKYSIPAPHWKLVCLCYHTWESCSSRREQGSPKALQSPRVPPMVVAAGYIWSPAAGVFIREERKEKENRNISQKSVSIYFSQVQGSIVMGKVFEAIHPAFPPSRTREHVWDALNQRQSKLFCLLPGQFETLSFPKKHLSCACKSFGSTPQ